MESARAAGTHGDEAAARAERRRRARERLGDGGVLVIAAAAGPRAGSDTELRYLADSNLYYLTGCEEPEAVLVLGGGAEPAPAYVLFVRGHDAERELWTGARVGVEEAAALFGADVVYPVSELPVRLPQLLQQADHLYYRLGVTAALDRLVLEVLASAREQRPRSGRGLQTISDPGRALDELRLVKDQVELGRIRAACELAVDSFRELRDVVRAGVGEWEIEAALEAAFRRRGASGPAFSTIVGSGANATVLHYSANRAVVRSGEVVLVDGGPRVAMYCADITRCYPASGRFTPAQRALYGVVWQAHDAAVAAARPGMPVSGIHEAALGTLIDGLLELGLLAGDPAALAAEPEQYRRYFPHRTSHWLGLDVHDVGDYLVAGLPRVLEPGMVLTVEPGLYIPLTDESAPAELRGTGIRLEDDVLVTAGGPEVLTAALPLDPDALFD